MKNILITGAAGGMGYATCKYLTEKGYKVFALDIAENFAMSNVAYIKTNLRDKNAVTNAKLPDKNSFSQNMLLNFKRSAAE